MKVYLVEEEWDNDWVVGRGIVGVYNHSNLNTLMIYLAKRE